MATLQQRMIGAMQADVKTFQEIEADPTAMSQAITVIVIAGVAALIGNIWRHNIMFGVMNMILSLLSYALFAFLVVIIGTKVMPEPATKADFAEAFRVIGFAASPGVFGVLVILPYIGPLIGMVIGIWSLVIGVIATREVLDYSNTGRAIVVCLLAGVVVFIVSVMLLTPILLGAAFLS
jgi:hypothetical protein